MKKKSIQKQETNDYFNIIKEELLNHSLDSGDISNVLKITEPNKILFLKKFLNDTGRKDLIEKFLVSTLKVPLEEICIIYKKHGVCYSKNNNWIRFTSGYNNQFNNDIYEIISSVLPIFKLPYNKETNWRTIYIDKFTDENKENIKEYISSLTECMIINYAYVLFVEEDENEVFVFKGEIESEFKYENLKISDKFYLVDIENIRKEIASFNKDFLVENQKKLYFYCNSEDSNYSLKFMNLPEGVYFTKFPFLLLRLSGNRAMRYFLYSTLKNKIIEMYYSDDIWAKKSMNLLVRQYLYNNCDVLLDEKNNLEYLKSTNETFILHNEIKNHANIYLRNKIKDRTITIIVANFDTMVFESKNSIAWFPYKNYADTIKKRLNINTNYIIAIEDISCFLNQDQTINYTYLEEIMNHEFIHLIEEESDDFKEIIKSNGLTQYVTHGKIFNQIEELIKKETNLLMSDYIKIVTQLILSTTKINNFDYKV